MASKTKATVVDIETSNATKSLADLRKQITDLKNELYTLTEGTETYNKKLQELGYAQDELNGFMAQTRQGCAALTGSYNALSYEMGVLKQQWKATNDEAEREAIGKQINAINDKLKEMDESIGNHQRNVGNYTKSMQEAFQNVGMTIGNINPLFSNLANAMVEAGEKGSKGFTALATGAKGLGTQLKALAANPVGAVIMAIVVAVKAAKAVFDKFKESVKGNEVAQNNLKKAMAPINAIVNAIKEAFDSFVETLTEVAAAIGNVISAFMSWAGIQDERVEAENQIAEMEIENAKLKRQYIVENSELDKEASDARAKAAQKDKYTNEERLAFMQEYADKQQKIAANNLDMAQKELALLEEQMAQGKNSPELENQLAEAKAKVNNVQKDYNNILRETNAQMSELNNQIKAEEEAQKKANEEKQKKWADEQKKLKEEYKSLMATYSDILNENDVEYQILKLTAKRNEELQKLDEQYKKHAISKKDYDKAVYLSEQALYKQSIALREQYQEQLEAFNEKYASMRRTDFQNELAEIDAQKNAAMKELMQWAETMTDEEFDYRQKMLNEYYSKVEKKAQMNNLKEKLAANQAFNDQMYKQNVASIELAYRQGKILTEDYFNAQFDLQIAANEQEMDLQKQMLEATKEVYGENSQEFYDMSLQVQLALTELELANDELIEEKQKAMIDRQFATYTALTDVMTSFMSDITSIGDGISAEWAKVFDNITSGVVAVGEALKAGKKGWSKWCDVAVAGISVVSSMLGALAAEEDTSTREGFEQNKKYQYGQAVMAMLSGIVNAWSSSMQLGFPANVIVGSILSTLITAVGGVQIAKIKNTQFDSATSASSGSSSSGVASVNTDAVSNLVAPVQWSSPIEGASAEENVKDTRVYVVESDIADAASRVNVAGSENRF